MASQSRKKVPYAMEAIRALGLDCTLEDANRWLKRNRNMDVSNSTFYHARVEMLEAQRHTPQVPAVPPEPLLREKTFNTEAAFGGFLNAIESAKRLVAETGSKKNAKELIDLI